MYNLMEFGIYSVYNKHILFNYSLFKINKTLI